MLPLLPLLCQEGDEARVLSKVIQSGISPKQRIAGEAVIGRDLQPFDGLDLRFFEHTVIRIYVDGGRRLFESHLFCGLLAGRFENDALYLVAYYYFNGHSIWEGSFGLELF